MEKKRHLYLDILRILACLMVLYHHSSANYFYEQCAGLQQAVYLFFGMLVRIDVPIFFMISGALLYGKTTSYREVGKKALRFVICLLVFELIVAGGYYILDGQKYTFIEFVKTFVRGALSRDLPGIAPYWYLYGYLGFLLLLPILQRAIRDIEAKEYAVLFGLHILFWTVIPLVNFAGNLHSEHFQPLSIYDAFQVPLATEKAFFFTITGYFVDKKLRTDRWSLPGKIVFLVSGLLAIAAMAVLTAVQGARMGFTQDYVQTFDYWIAIVFFVGVKLLTKSADDTEKHAKLKKTLGLFATLTFGIYLLDPVWHMLGDRAFNALTAGWPPLLAGFLWCLFSFIAGGILTFLLKLIPGVKKFL